MTSKEDVLELDLTYLEYQRALRQLQSWRIRLEHHWLVERMELRLEPERQRDAEFRAGLERLREVCCA